MSKKEVVRISLYMPVELKERVQEIAKDQNKTMSALIVEWLEDRAVDADVDLVDAIRRIEERLAALEDKTRNL